MSFYLNDDIFKMILNVRRREMRYDTYKPNYDKVINELNQINNMIHHYIDYDEYDGIRCDDDVVNNLYSFSDFNNDVIDNYIETDVINDYKEGVITYKDFYEIIKDGINNGMYFYDFEYQFNADNICGLYDGYIDDADYYYNHHVTFIGDYDDDLVDTYKNNKNKIHSIIKMILKYKFNGEIDDINNYLTNKDYVEVRQLFLDDYDDHL